MRFDTCSKTPEDTGLGGITHLYNATEMVRRMPCASWELFRVKHRFNLYELLWIKPRITYPGGLDTKPRSAESGTSDLVRKYAS